ncbi:MAG: DNA polymerase III subunit alpha [Bdellovibrionales bacterium]
MSFVHLHVHSQYSLLEATCRAKSLAKKTAEYGMPAVALTDYGNMFGAIEFYFACKDAGVKPILGLEVFIAPKSRLVKGEDKEAAQQPSRRLVLLAQNYEGYRSLCHLSSIGYQEGFYYRPRVDYETLSRHNENVIALSGGLMGEVAWTFNNRGPEAALERIETFKKIYGDRFYLELCRTGVKGWDQLTPFLLEAGEKMGVPVVASNDVHYLTRDDQLAQEVLICIGTNKTLQDETRFRLGSDQFYFKSPQEMRDLFGDLPRLCDRTLEVAERCNTKFNLKDANGGPIYHLPSYPTANGVSLQEEISRLAREGLKRRFEEAERRGEAVPAEQHPKYHERLNFELDVIGKMGFHGYFLIVQDFIGWAKEQGIPVGPGRGSGAGSLVAYSLRITDLDPMPYNLIFERFLNPERISMPDFDIDFCQEHRGRVIEYVTQKYGRASVSQIITYGKLQARAAIRDVGRVMGMTYAEVDTVSKLVPEKLGINLSEAIEMEPRLRELMEMDPKVNTLMELAQKIEGLVRHAGIHAAGVVIADGNIVDHAPLYRGADGENVVQYDMKHAEKIGLIKFDFLGLKTLTHIQEALDLVAKNRGKHYTVQDISLRDPGIYSIMCLGDTAGIFQFEGEGITDLIRKARPSCFEDIVAINALYRPGPMDMIPDYLARKHGEKKVEYLFPQLEEILRETYGVIVYQEQVQLVAARIANYSLGEADMLRRAMGKKIAEEMAVQKTRFLQGAKENGHDLKKAEELFDTMAEFAKYGFNKSHAAAYCVVAAHTAWLKNYYTVEFYAALLSTEMSDTDRIVKYVKDAQQHKIEVVPPHINYSEYKFSVGGDKILFSLGAIKGVGEGPVRAIVEARERLPQKKFESLEQFFEELDLKRVNKKTIEALIKAGALDGFGYNRNELLSGFGRFIDRAEGLRAEREVGQTSLFDLAGEEVAEDNRVKLDRLEPWTRALTLSFEKEVLGFYLSDHPLRGLEVVSKIYGAQPVEEVSRLEPKSKVHILGLVSSYREIITKKGTRMAFARLEDMTGNLELVVFPDTYAQYERILKAEAPILVGATLEKDEGNAKLIAESLKAAEEIFKQIKRVTLDLDPSMEGKMSLVRQWAEKYPGEAVLTLRLRLPDLNQCVEVEPREMAGVQPSSESLDGLLRLGIPMGLH